MMIKRMEHHRNATLDYGWDWATKWLAPGTTIVSFTLSADPGIMLTNTVNTNGVITTRATAVQSGKITCSITTNTGLNDSRSFYLQVVDP